MPKLMKKQNASKEKKKKKGEKAAEACREEHHKQIAQETKCMAKDFFLAAQKSPAVLKYIWAGLKVWLQLFFKVFFTHKYIKIIYIFYFLKIIFDINISK